MSTGTWTHVGPKDTQKHTDTHKQKGTKLATPKKINETKMPRLSILTVLGTEACHPANSWGKQILAVLISSMSSPHHSWDKLHLLAKNIFFWIKRKSGGWKMAQQLKALHTHAAKPSFGPSTPTRQLKSRSNSISRRPGPLFWPLTQGTPVFTSSHMNTQTCT